MPADKSELHHDLAHFMTVRRHGTASRRYLERRAEFATEIGHPDMWHLVDQFGLFAGSQTITTYLAVADLVRRTISVPGHVLEFGTRHGGKLLYMAKLLEALSSNSVKKVFGFDTFEGLQTFAKEDGADSQSMRGGYLGDEATLRAAIKLFELEEWVHLVKGDARETIPAFGEAYPHIMVSLAYLDFDLYEPTKVALDFVAPRLATGGIIAMDQAMTDFFPGEGQALLEFLQDLGGHQFEMSMSPETIQPTVWLTKK